MGWPKGKPHGRIPTWLFGPKSVSHKEKIGAANYKGGPIKIPLELKAFRRMHDRVRDGKVKSIAWSRTIDGFMDFLLEIGICPHIFDCPSVGRIDHARGYEPGNIAWQEHAVNSRLRRGTRHEREAYPV